MGFTELPVRQDPIFERLIALVGAVGKRNGSSAAALMIIRQGQIVAEWYDGRQTLDHQSRIVQRDSRFNVYSVRKSYIGFAVSYALQQGFIQSLDDLVSRYLDEPTSLILGQTTVRHLLTHIHGLDGEEETLIRRFEPGKKWNYTNTGILLLNRLVEKVSGMTVSELLQREVFTPQGLTETGWCVKEDDKLVHDVSAFRRQAPILLGSGHGDDRNLYVSTRDLAYWGWMHLTENPIFKRMITVQTPDSLDRRFPRQGFCWWVQTPSVRMSEIGSSVPEGAAQIVGFSGCLCLIIPSYQVVAVRMYNSFGGRLTFVRDARNFGDRLMECL